MSAVNVAPEQPDVMQDPAGNGSSRSISIESKDRAARHRLRRAISTHRLAFTLFVVDGICAGVLAIQDHGKGAGSGTKAGLLATIVIFVATALQTITASAEKLDLAKRNEVTARVEEEKSRRVATDVHVYYSERLPSLLDYVGAFHAEPSREKRKQKVEALESLVVDSAATLYGKKDLRAVVLHYDSGKLIPGAYRRGFDGTPSPRLDGAGQATRHALRLIQERKSICVDNPDDVRHSDYLTLRPSDNFRSYIRVPIVAGDQGYGILWVDGHSNNSLMEADVASVRALASILASALAVTVDQQNRLACA